MAKIDAGIAALIGAATGAIAAIIGTIIAQRYESKRLKTATILRQKEKLTEKRIKAHEKIIELADILNNTESYSENLQVKNNSILRGPSFLRSGEIFGEWHQNIFNHHIRNQVWLAPKVKYEIHLLQNYLMYLYSTIESLENSEVQEVGVAIRGDFMVFANNLRNWSQEYLSYGALLLDLSDIDTSWKYDDKTIEERLKNTELFKGYIESK